MIDNEQAGGYGGIGKSPTGGAAATAAAPSGNPFLSFSHWINNELRKGKTAQLEFGGVDCDVVSITDDGRVALKKADGVGVEYLPVSDRLVGEIMEQIR